MDSSFFFTLPVTHDKRIENLDLKIGWDRDGLRNS